MRTHAALVVGLLTLGAFLSACGGTDAPTDAGPAAGAERGPCYGNQTCNAGLVCLSDICVAAPDGGAPTDAGVASPDAAPADTGHDAGASDADVVVDGGPVDGGPVDAGEADAGPVDSGASDGGFPDAGFPDAGFPDTGVRPDAGPEAMCDPVAATGCPSSTDFCLWDPRYDHRECAPPQGNLGLEAPCDEALQNCAPGYACARTGTQTAPECHRVCDVFAGGLSCQNLPGAHPYYNCSVINGSRQYGVCLGRGTYCDPLAPACPAGEVCSLDGSQTTCQPAGVVQRDQACSPVDNCAVDQGMCIDLGAGSVCRLPCDPNQASTCGASARCVQITNRPFGVCLPVDCQPFTNPCPSGFVCSAVNGPVECRPAGAVSIGASCAAANECATGVCVDISGTGPRCEQPCDANNPCAGGGQICVTLTGFGFGICR